jgi:hypothetical protein
LSGSCGPTRRLPLSQGALGTSPQSPASPFGSPKSPPLAALHLQSTLLDDAISLAHRHLSPVHLLAPTRCLPVSAAAADMNPRTRKLRPQDQWPWPCRRRWRTNCPRPYDMRRVRFTDCTRWRCFFSTCDGTKRISLSAPVGLLLVSCSLSIFPSLCYCSYHLC